jgi:hypothetical protein
MTRLGTTTLAVAAVLATTGCASLSAAKGPAGQPITLAVAFQRSAETTNVDQVQQVTDFMQPDLERMLTDAGYDVVRQADAAGFQPGPNRYLVVVRLTRYNPGSKAARMMVGFGAGALVLDSEFELHAGPGAVLLAEKASVGSSRDWNHAARKTNQQVAQAVTNRLLSAR